MFNILQNLTLTAAANGALLGADVSALWPTASAFAFVERCRFESNGGELIAENPLQWIAELRYSSSRGIWLHGVPRRDSTPDYEDVAFANGGRRWILETVRSDGSQLWEGFVRYKKASTAQPWEITYRQISANCESRSPDAMTIRSTRAALLDALADLKRFAFEEDVGYFAKVFEDAMNALDAPPPTNDPYLNEIVTFVDLPSDARQLYHAMRTAWVFGGMGSWNDRVFEGDREALNRQLSATLYQRICESAVAIAKCTFPQQVSFKPA